MTSSRATILAIAAVVIAAGAPLVLSAQRPVQRLEHTLDDISARARQIHQAAIVLDTHIDTTQRLMRPGWSFFERHAAPIRGGAPGEASHVDLPRMREGGFDGAFFSIFMPGTVTGPQAVKRALDLIDAVRHLAETHPDDIVLATTAADVRAAHKAGKIAALMGMEGGHMIDDDLAVLRNYQRLGVRYLTLSHSVNTNWSDSSGDKPVHNGLTDFGKDVVRELNRLGVMVDISHVSDKTFWDTLEVSKAPLLASHSSCRAISGHARNMTDDMIKALAAKDGVIQINYADSFLDNDLYQAQEKVRPQMDALRAELEKKYPESENAEKRMADLRAAQAAIPMPRVSWEKIVEHIDHVVKLAGADHVGLGSDFDGASMPEGMEDCTKLPKITEALLAKGYSEQDIKNILGENLLRLMDRVDQVGKEIRAAHALPGSPGWPGSE